MSNVRYGCDRRGWYFRIYIKSTDKRARERLHKQLDRGIDDMIEIIKIEKMLKKKKLIPGGSHE